jgi:hypothetical protein
MTEQMLDYYEFNSHHNKVIRVIRSCETLEQLENAQRFSEIVIRFHILKMKDDAKSMRKPYKLAIEKSSELMNQALNDHRKKILRDEK